MTKCVLVSFFNSNNLGDLLIGDALNNLVQDKFEVVEKISYSGDLRPFEGSNLTINATKSNKGKIMDYIKNIGLGPLLSLYYTKVKKYNLDFYRDKISNSDALVIGGGNMIFDLDKYTLSGSRFYEFIKIAKDLNKPIFAISLGIGPFQTEKQEIKAVKSLGLCDYITFRDEASYNIFKKHDKIHNNVYVSIDPVFNLPNKIEESAKNKVIALNIINNKLLENSETKYNNINIQYAKLIDNLQDNFSEDIILFSTEIADYEAIFDVYNLTKKSNKIKVFEVTNTAELFDLYDKTKIIIGTRMHAMIIAHTQNIPLIGLSWQKKVEEMFKIIESEESLFQYDLIIPSMSEIIESAKYKIENIEDEKFKIQNNLTKINNKNLINITILDKLISKILNDI